MLNKVKVNLKEMYPLYYKQDVFVYIDQSVYDVMDQYEHIDDAYYRKLRYHKAYFSTSEKPYLENNKIDLDISDNFLIKEFIHHDLINYIEKAINDLPAKEKERILKKYVQCKTLESIALEENCSATAVYYSIKIALNKIKEILITNGYEVDD